MSEGASNVEVLPIAGRIGAEIRGIRLSGDLSPGVTASIREAWLKHKVVFFRGQQHLDEASQGSLTGLFGAAPVGHPTGAAG
jgi:alpha-ketoglutarate-dependent sulfate ester dioxygenase